MRFDIVDRCTPGDIADALTSHTDKDSDDYNRLQTFAWDLANMAGLEFEDDEELAEELGDLDGDLVRAVDYVIRSYAVDKDLVFFSDSDLGLALRHSEVWQAVIKELRDSNISLSYGDREFLWIS